MIFVTVGTHNQSFERLVKAIDIAVGEDEITEKVIVQTGYTNYKPKNCESFGFISNRDFINFCKKSSVVITHGGVGSIMTSLNLNKRTIVVPRLKSYGEHLDDHQLQIVKELERQGRILPVYDIKKLSSTIKAAKKMKIKRKKQTSKIFNVIEKKLKEWEKNENNSNW